MIDIKIGDIVEVNMGAYEVIGIGKFDDTLLVESQSGKIKNIENNEYLNILVRKEEDNA